MLSLCPESASRDWVNSKEKVDFKVDCEAATRDAFAIVHRKCGYRILKSNDFFPDYTLEDAKGREVRAEAKYFASKLKDSEKDCGLVICWVGDWYKYKIPKLVVSDYVQERPDFEGFREGEQLNIGKVLGVGKQVSRVLKGINDIALDVLTLLKLDYRVECLLGDCFCEGNLSVECVRHGDRYYADVLSSCWYGEWDPRESSVRLWIDFDAEVIEVRADLGRQVITKFNGNRWRRILDRVNQSGYAIKGESERAVTSKPAYEGGLNGLLKEIKDGNVSQIALTRGYRLDRVLFGDPYDVVERLHVWVAEMLKLMKREELYVMKKHR